MRSSHNCRATLHYSLLVVIGIESAVARERQAWRTSIAWISARGSHRWCSSSRKFERAHFSGEVFGFSCEHSTAPSPSFWRGKNREIKLSMESCLRSSSFNKLWIYLRSTNLWGKISPPGKFLFCIISQFINALPPASCAALKLIKISRLNCDCKLQHLHPQCSAISHPLKPTDIRVNRVGKHCRDMSEPSSVEEFSEGSRKKRGIESWGSNGKRRLQTFP